ncbi:hypothetical protein [Christiangramia sp.]|uniref:hypothetical protein n=1 Tax=Christiangramia sp. TaxID=1931228 RepID=UPI00260CD598|nr:hypothetical protein [Christiangramia sp.]
MKNILTILLIFIGMTSFAQERGERRSDLTTEEMATLGAKRLAMQLDLNQDQEEKLKELYVKRIEAIKDFQEKRKEKMEERKEMHSDRLEMNEEQKAELREILLSSALFKKQLGMH